MTDKELVMCQKNIRDHFKWNFPFSISYNDAFIALNLLERVKYTIKNDSVQLLLMDNEIVYIKHISFKSNENGLLALIWCIDDVIKHLD